MSAGVSTSWYIQYMKGEGELYIQYMKAEGE